MIEVNNLTKRYGPHLAIDRLNFKIGKGEVVGFLGPNGAGKSTTMKIVTGFMAPTSGFVKVAGFDVFENPIEVKRRIGYLPEIPPVYGDMYVRDYLSFVANLKGVPKTQVRRLVDQAIEKANLGQVHKRLIQNLSKGFRQRVGVAQAIVSNPEILILDEPTVGLDPKQVAEIRALITELSGHHTIILSTHILSEVQATCKRIIIINHGRIVAEDSLEGLTRRVSGARRIYLKLRRPGRNMVDSLRGVGGVLHVESLESNSWHVDTEENDDITENIAAHVVNSGFGLTELKVMNVSLEDIFLKLTAPHEMPSPGVQK